MVSRALCFFALTIAGCRGDRPPAAPSAPPPAERIVASGAQPDDGRLHLYRSYFAIERVGREAHHFTAFWHDVEPCHCEVSVLDGQVALTGCMFGGMSVPPPSVPAVPADRSADAALVERAVMAKSPKASRIQIRFGGSYREIVVSEMILVSQATIMNKPVGWHGRVFLAADGALSRIDGMAPGMSSTGYGMIDIPADAARVDFVLPPSDDGQRLVSQALLTSGGKVPEGAGHARALLDRVLAVSRDIAAKKAVPTIGALLSAPIDPSLPAAYDQPVGLSVTLYARRAAFQGQQHRALVLRLHPREAAEKGQATASAETDVDGIHVKASAKMSAFTPSSAPAQAGPVAHEGRDMEATVAVHVEDDRGNVFDRTYPARGKVVGQAPALATPAGLVMPGTSSPSKEADALRFRWPGNGQASSFDFYIDPQLHAAPTNP